MAFNGSGVFNRLYNWVNDAAAGIKIRADRIDAEMNGFATGLSNCVTKDGQTTVTANLPMASFRHTGVGNATARNHYLSFAQAQDGAPSYIATVGGTANAITLSNAIPMTAYVAGQSFTFVATAANTGAVTVNIDGLGARNLRKRNNAALISDDILIGQPCTIFYDGTQFYLTSANRSMVAADLATNSVTTTKIADDNVTTAKIPNDAVTYAKIQNVSASDRLLGRSTAGAGDIEEITCTAAGRAILDDADAAAQRTTLGLTGAASATYVASTTFTPTAAGSSTAGVGTYTTQTGRYQRIGNKIDFQVELTWTAHTGTGFLFVSGLPVNSAANSPVSILGLNIAGISNQVLKAMVVSGTTNIGIYLEGVNGSASLTAVGMDAAATVYLQGSYFV
jgi:hypothetical protein